MSLISQRRWRLALVLGHVLSTHWLCTIASSAESILSLSNVPLPDPFPIHLDGHWHVFGTSRAPHFYLRGESLEPGALRPAPLHLDYAAYTARVRAAWAFSAFQDLHSTCHGYGTLHLGDFNTVVGHFVRVAPTHWRLESILLGIPNSTKQHFYDASVVTDDDGSLYLLYTTREGEHTNVICAQRMAAPGKLDVSEPPRILLRPQGYRSELRNEVGGLQLVEAPRIGKLQEKFVLLYSVGDFQLANYKIGIAYSDRLIPLANRTYSKPLAPDPSNVWNNDGKSHEVVYLLQSQVPKWHNYCAEHVISPGVGNFHAKDGKHWLIFHGYRPNDVAKPTAGKLDSRWRYVFRAPLEIRISENAAMRDWIRVVE